MNASRMYQDDRLELSRNIRNENAMGGAVAWQWRQKSFSICFICIYIYILKGEMGSDDENDMSLIRSTSFRRMIRSKVKYV